MSEENKTPWRIPRLSNSTGYNRPRKTYQDKLTAEQIKEKLKGYVEKDVDEIPLHTHCRYFIIDPRTGKKKFRTGGLLHLNNHSDYVIMSNGSLTWSVQKRNTIFFALEQREEIREKCDKEIKQLQEENKYLRELYRETKRKSKSKQ